MGGSYGGFLGGDPRRFTPDDEMCTVAEIAAWRDACAAWDQGLRPEADGHIRVYDANGTLILHVARNPFGIGVTTWDGDDEPDEEDDDSDDDGPDDPTDLGDDEPADAEPELTEVTTAWIDESLDANP